MGNYTIAYTYPTCLLTTDYPMAYLGRAHPSPLPNFSISGEPSSHGRSLSFILTNAIFTSPVNRGFRFNQDSTQWRSNWFHLVKNSHGFHLVKRRNCIYLVKRCNCIHLNWLREVTVSTREQELLGEPIKYPIQRLLNKVKSNTCFFLAACLSLQIPVRPAAPAQSAAPEKVNVPTNPTQAHVHQGHYERIDSIDSIAWKPQFQVRWNNGWTINSPPPPDQYTHPGWTSTHYPILPFSHYRIPFNPHSRSPHSFPNPHYPGRFITFPFSQNPPHSPQAPLRQPTPSTRQDDQYALPH